MILASSSRSKCSSREQSDALLCFAVKVNVKIFSLTLDSGGGLPKLVLKSGSLVFNTKSLCRQTCNVNPSEKVIVELAWYPLNQVKDM